MASKKKQLVRKARALNLDSVGTIAQLERRIEKAQASALAETVKQVPPQVAVLTVAPKPETKPDAVKVPSARIAHPVRDYTEIQTRVALKTTVKFIGRWYTLRKGEKFIAPKAVIDSLEERGFLKKK